MVFQVKICGVTNLGDARAAVDAGADAIGLNFVSQSRRFVEPDSAKQIVKQLSAGITKVGVFVNHDARQIDDIVTHVGLDVVQLHGDEPASLLTQLPRNVQIVRAYRCGPEGFARLEHYLRECMALFRWPDAVLIDANAGADFGGSGELADWNQIRRERQCLMDLPLVLAGGLTPDNVALAIATVTPRGVDVASGVERGPGRKDPWLIAKFVAEAREAFARI